MSAHAAAAARQNRPLTHLDKRVAAGHDETNRYVPADSERRQHTPCSRQQTTGSIEHATCTRQHAMHTTYSTAWTCTTRHRPIRWQVSLLQWVVPNVGRRGRVVRKQRDVHIPELVEVVRQQLQTSYNVRDGANMQPVSSLCVGCGSVHERGRTTLNAVRCMFAVAGCRLHHRCTSPCYMLRAQPSATACLSVGS